MVRVQHSPDGKFVLSAGPQFLRRYITEDTSEPVHFDFDSSALCLAVSGNKLAVGCEDGSVKLYSIDDHKYERDLYGGSTPVRSVEFSPDGIWVAISTHEKSLLVNSDDITTIKSIAKPSRNLSWHPTEELVTVSGQDSTLYFFEDEGIQAKIEGVLPTVDLVEDRATGAVWSPAGDVFGIPTKSLDFVIYDRAESLEQFRLVHKEPIIKSEWSPNGRYVACLLTSGSIFIWSVGDRTTVAIEKLDSCASFAWHPFLNQMSWISNAGSIEKFVPIPENRPSPVGEIVSGKHGLEQDNEEELILSGSEDDLIDEEDVDDLFTESRSLHRAGTNKRARILEERAFQSGSTPWNNRKRILTTNYVGYVWTTYQDDQHNTVTATFFDQGTHRDFHFEDENMYDLAALSDRGTLFANSKSGKVFMRFHDSRVDSWEYQCSGPIRAVTTSNKIAVLCTASGIVHTFSIYGNSISITRESRDPVLTCAAHDNSLMIVRSGGSGPSYTIEDPVTQRYFQKNDPVDVAPGVSLTSLFFNDNGDPCIFDSKGVLSTLVHWRDPLQARWVPVFDGTEYAASQERDHSYWPIGIIGGELLCIVLKNKKTFPQVPLPVTSQVALKIPGLSGHEGEYILCNVMHQQTHARVASGAASGATSDAASEAEQELSEKLEESESQLNMLLLKQLQNACNDNRPNKCLAIASLITTDQALEIAAQIAVRYNLHSVAERIQNQS